MNTSNEKLNLINDLIDACTQVVENRKQVREIIRRLCREFGGITIYIPSIERKSNTADDLFEVLQEVAGKNTEKVLERIMSLLGGFSYYIPQEIRTFRNEIAAEIYERYDGKQTTLRLICREYRISYVQMYRLYHLHRNTIKQQSKEKKQ